MYNIKLEKFEGPLDLLLQLIELEEMDISEISLARIADEFIEYIRGGKVRDNEMDFAHRKIPPNHHLGKVAGSGIDANELSDFLVIAAKLLYIKSRYLMPFLEYDGEEEEIGDLENRLKIYKEFLDASKNIEEYYGSGKVSYVREKLEIGQEIGRIRQAGHILGIGQIGGIRNGEDLGFFPPEKLEKENLKSAFEELIGNLRSPFILDQENMERIITVQERIEQIRLLIFKKSDISFTKIINISDKKDIIVSFLSILELVKEQFIAVKQDGYFEEIFIRRTNYEL